MIEVKQLSLRFTDADLERIKAGKLKGETWEEYIFRLAVKGGK